MRSLSFLTVAITLAASSAHAQSDNAPGIAFDRGPMNDGTPSVDADATPPDAKETTRLRGGFSFNGGAGFGAISGPVVSASARVGVQFNRYVGAYYQNTPTALLAMNGGSSTTSFMDLNTAMLSISPIDQLEIAAGPSLDYYNAVGLGVHGRVALDLASRNPQTGRRSAFSLGVDVHPIFGDNGTLVIGTIGLGGEWF